MPGIPVRVRSVDGRSIFRLFGKPADGRLTGVCEISVVCDYDTCRTSQQAAYYRPFDEHSLDSELGAAEKPCGHSAGDGTETEANDEVAQAKERCLEVEPEAAGPGGVVCCRQPESTPSMAGNILAALPSYTQITSE